jgi:hypothetical protein
LFSGLLVLEDYAVLKVTGGEFGWSHYLPAAALVAEAVNAPAYWIARKVLFFFGQTNVSNLAVIVTALPAAAVLWYLVGAWLDGRSDLQPGRQMNRALRWMLLLLAAVLYLMTLVDAAMACFLGFFWMPAFALSRWAWATFFLYSQLSALRAGPRDFTWMRLSGR